MTLELGILGGGFGIYGYLPAAVDNGWNVKLLEKYRKTIQDRVELNYCLESCIFVQDESEILSSVDYLVIARIPKEQYRIVSNLKRNYEKLFLEKPLAPRLENHRQIIDRLIQSNQDFSVGYLFPYSSWWKSLSEQLGSKILDEVNIDWKISTPLSDWKREIGFGGGLRDYYAVHFVPIIQEFSPLITSYNFSQIEDQLHIDFKIDKEIKFKISASLGTENSFCVTGKSEGTQRYFHESETPFGSSGKFGKPDDRIPLLSKYLASGVSQDSSSFSIVLEERVLKFRSA